MSENPVPDPSVSGELRNLGKNLLGALQAIWETPEFKQFQQELVTGLGELSEAAKKEANNFNDSPTGQQIRTEVGQIGERLRTGEAQESVRKELINALKLANTELDKVVQKWSTSSTQAPGVETAPDESASPAGGAGEGG
jgi:hypothetical protein